jgi:hypothetical protein
LQILEKYSLKLEKFQEINKFLYTEKTSVLQADHLKECQLKDFSDIFSLKGVQTSYLEPSNQDYEETNSIYVSFENKEIFENAIKLSKIEGEGKSDLSHCNFKKQSK